MGGNAFKDVQGNVLTSPIPGEHVEPTLDHFLRAVLKPIGIDAYEKLGSTGKKALSGDLDIAVGIGDENKTKFKKEFVKKVGQILEPNRSKAVGQLAAVMYPIVNESGNMTGESVQIDIMFTPTPEHTAWVMSGSGEDRVKGVYRNLLFAHIAKQRSLSQQAAGNNVKMTISFPGGLQVKRGGDVVVPRTSDPKKVLKLLGIDADPSEVSTFEDLVEYMRKDPKLHEYLETFKDYIAPYLERDTKNAQRAVQHIEQSGDVVEALRRFVRLVLRS